MTPIATAGSFAVWRAGRLIAVGATLMSALAVTTRGDATTQDVVRKAPQTLAETGLYADAGRLKIDPRHLAFSPQYPLWSDGAIKRRWLSLPPGAAIDASDPDAWSFPVGTRFWKEFSFNGQKVETRYMELQASGQWLYAAYAWTADGADASLVSEQGKRGAYPLGPARTHAIPSVNDCKACHQGGRTEVLGFSMLQLSPDRDPGALHAESQPRPVVDLDYLVAKSVLVGLPKALQDRPPRIVAASATARAALGYMHGNCGHCHNDQGPLKNVALFLRFESAAGVRPAMASTIGHPVRKPAPGQASDALLRIDPHRPERSAILQRISSRYRPLQMPPLGTELVDQDAVALLRQWISEAEVTDQTSHDKRTRP